MENRALFLLDGLTPAQQNACWQMEGITETAYPKGSTVYDSRTAQRALVLVVSGSLRVLQNRVVMNTLGAGDVFGAAALFGHGEEYPTSVVAVTDCRLVFISQETGAKWMAAYPAVAHNYVAFLSDRIRFLNTRLATLTAGATDGKLWQFLKANADQNGAVALPGGRKELAQRLNMGRSSLYRALDALAAAGKIIADGKTIILTDQGGQQDEQDEQDEQD